jgi:hypothetical protein
MNKQIYNRPTTEEIIFMNESPVCDGSLVNPVGKSGDVSW